MTLAILGIGTALPATELPSATVERVIGKMCHLTELQAGWLHNVSSHSGIRARFLAHSPEVVDDVLHGTNHSRSPFLPKGIAGDRGPTTAERMQHYAASAGPLALKAARQALHRAGVAPGEITHLVTVSCTGFHAPGPDIDLIRGLGLSPETQRTHVGYMGCHGALNGLRVARGLACAEPAARVLLCAVELCSLHFSYQWNPQQVIANLLFADGAAALVGASASTAPSGAWQAVASGSCVFPDSARAMTWAVTDHGFAMTLSKQVPNLIAANLRGWLTSWLERQGLSLEEIGSWAVHPGGPKILEAVEESLGLTREQMLMSREVFASCGNMSSPTLLFILERLFASQAPRPCVALGFGPGLAVEAALLR